MIAIVFTAVHFQNALTFTNLYTYNLWYMYNSVNKINALNIKFVLQTNLIQVIHPPVSINSDSLHNVTSENTISFISF